jgi:hypothetical protein
LTGDELAIDDYVHAPVFDFGENGTEADKLVLDQERHNLRKTYSLFLGVGEAGDITSLNKRGTIGIGHAMQDARCMANESDRLAGCNEGFDELDRIRIFGQIPERAVAAGVEKPCRSPSG